MVRIIANKGLREQLELDVGKAKIGFGKRMDITPQITSG